MEWKCFGYYWVCSVHWCVEDEQVSWDTSIRAWLIPFFFVAVVMVLVVMVVSSDRVFFQGYTWVLAARAQEASLKAVQYLLILGL